MHPQYQFIAETVVDCMLMVKQHAKYDGYTLEERAKVGEGIGLLAMTLWLKCAKGDGAAPTQETFVDAIQDALLDGLFKADSPSQ